MMSLIYRNVHLGGGAPARGTELAELIFRNLGPALRNVVICEGAVPPASCFALQIDSTRLPASLFPALRARLTSRDLFTVRHRCASASAGTVMIYSRYGKTQTLKGKQAPVARFLPSELAGLLIGYLTLIRPVEVSMALLLAGQNEEDTQLAHKGRYALFWRNGSPMSEQILCRDFATGLVERGIPLQFQQHRHGIAGILRDLKIDQDIEDVLLTEEQEGHSRARGMASYAVRVDIVAVLRSDKFYNFLQVSKAVHALLRWYVALTSRPPRSPCR
jgi:hypothetical protein